MASLPEYDFEPHYMEAEGCHIHYIDAGDKGSPVIVFLHGVPT